ncbi:PHD finger protein 14 [Elysia marginata]|uniref:PHD finger protein 14 n=1 Tax=Elysia marginata TaxID=1093978 RepID=A0AAV4G3Q9_9GAST|nr:PHD finger protein 14 [Elysia marginata]
MAAPMKDEKSVSVNDNETSNNPSIHPSVNFLYKTMLQRDPGKRRVKPVADNLVQINFGGLEDEDSEEDSDFDILQQPQGSAAMDSFDEDDEEESLGSDEMKEDNEEPYDNTEDKDMNDEGSVASENRKNRETETNGSQSAAADKGNEDEDEDEKLASESGSEQEDDEMEETSDEFESDEDDSDEDAEDEGDNDDDDDDDEGSVKDESSKIKGLGQVLDMIDSDEDDEDYVPKKKKKKSSAPPAQKTASTPKKSKVKSKKVATAEKSKASTESTSAALSVVEATPQARIKVIVCCVCLSDRSADEDEIVECDNCGIAVHEGCYGISESHSHASTVSSASTEPWFCDACKANADPVCELCPNSGGIFKETDNGKWVHIVCALYTPGVAFGDVDRLSLVTLFEMPYSKWGAKECSLCEDSRFSQTGVCINCDAGMCKAYFHVTCAQREGLLAEVTPEDAMEVADPFFAYCKLHADKMTSKIKRRNWLAIQSHVKTHKPSAVEDGAEKLRFQRKLQHHRDKHGAAKLKKPPAWVPAQKMVRHLHTSPSAVRSFLKKAELMGVITQSQTTPIESQEIRKKTQGQPAFSGDFITYYMERNLKIDNLKTLSTELSAQNKTLQTQEVTVRRKYDKLTKTVKELQVKGTSLRKEGESLCGMLQNIYGKPVPNIPEIFKAKKRTRSPSKKETAAPESVIIHSCGICGKTKQQHLMAKCDSCKKHFHLGCLNPPLTRMPKKTKLFGWQCSFCALSSSDGSVKSAPDPDQPRKLRETIKEPDKFFHMSHVQASLDSQRKKSMLNRRSKQRRQTAQARRDHRQKQLRKNSASESSRKKPSTGSSPGKAKGKKSASPKKLSGNVDGAADPSVQPSPSKRTAGKVSVKKDTVKAADVPIVDIMCVVCNGAGTLTDTIRCDECKLFYHLACLDPPMKKSPKVRGYVWHCEACDMDESSEDDGPPRRKKLKNEKQQPEALKSPITLASGREGREASNSILFDIDVSSDD